MKRLRGKSLPDLRYRADDQTDISGGTLYRQACYVQIWYCHGLPETYLADSVAEAMLFFKEKKKELN